MRKFFFYGMMTTEEVINMYSIRSYVVGLVQENCYFISNAQKETLIIDPGDQGMALVKEIRKNHLKPVAILLTHTHFDHIGGVEDIRSEFDIPVYVHAKEQHWLQKPTFNGSAKYQEIPNIIVRPAEKIIQAEGTYTVGPFTFDVLHTPGHSPGSITFSFVDERFAIVGDTLFEGSIGRTDLIDGNEAVLLQSIQEKILSLDDQTMIYPGHGNPTTVEKERATNPFL